jgi:hypothetical protein
MRNIDRTQVKARELSQRVKAAFKVDRVRRASLAGEAIEAAVKSKDYTGAWGRLKAWYRQASDRPPKPTRRDLQAVTQERIDLYQARAPPGDPIPVHVMPFAIPDGPPTEAEISEAVIRLRKGKAPGPTGLRSDHIKDWYAAAKRKEQPDTSKWDAFVRLLQHVYTTGEIPAQMAWSTVVLLPKSDGGVRGIGLLEVTWKVLSSLVDKRISRNITYHDSVHGFRAKRGTGTAVFEAKLFHQLATIHQVPVYEVFLDLKKAYDSVDRDRTLAVLKGYGVGERMLRLFHRFWDAQVIVARQGGFYGEPFKATRGVTQGDPASPTLFNVLVDAIVRHWLTLVLDDGSTDDDGLGLSVRHRLVLFYADDGLIAARDNDWLQSALGVLTELFERVGLQTNTSKTKAMTCIPGYISTRISSPSYKRRTGRGGPSYRARQRQRVECPVCEAGLAAGSLKQHMLTQHGTDMGVDLFSDRADTPGRQPQEYRISFPALSARASCPVDGCTGVSTTRTNLRRHFVHRHPQDTLCILEEGSHPLPKCELCGMHVPYIALNRRHYDSELCQAGAA